jgi:hypothetical protein
VPDPGGRSDDAAAHAVRELDVLGVHPTLVEALPADSTLVQSHVAAADQHVAVGGQIADGTVAHRDRGGEAGDVGGQHLASHDRHLGRLERGDQFGHPVRFRTGVGVKERDQRRTRGGDAEIAAAGDVVAAVAQDSDRYGAVGRERPYQRQGVINGVVIDDEDLGGASALPVERVHACLDGRRAVVGQDDHGQVHSAP